jgi:hypothetical protein
MESKEILRAFSIFSENKNKTKQELINLLSSKFEKFKSVEIFTLFEGKGYIENSNICDYFSNTNAPKQVFPKYSISENGKVAKKQYTFVYGNWAQRNPTLFTIIMSFVSSALSLSVGIILHLIKGC